MQFAFFIFNLMDSICRYVVWILTAFSWLLCVARLMKILKEQLIS